MDGEIVPMPDESGGPSESADGEALGDATLALVKHPLDTSQPVPMRSKQEIIKEAVLLVPNLAKLLFRLLLDKRVSRKRRMVMALVAGYVASPIDLIPDFIPVLGSLDDVFVLAFAVDYLLEASPPEVVEELWDGSEDSLEIVRGIAGWGAEMLPDRLRHFVDRR